MIRALLLSTTLIFTAQPSKVEQNTDLKLSVLQSGCRVIRSKFGLEMLNTPSAWLECGGCKVLVNHPNNFVQKVLIKNESQALEYVRFFSSPETYDLFELGGDVELVPSKNAMSGKINEVEEADFEKYFKRPVVREFGLGEKAEFSVTRYVVALDQKTYEVVETVREDGYYSKLTRRFVIDAETVGVVHLGHF